MISKNRFTNRCPGIEAALVEKLQRLRRTRLTDECAKLDPREERALAEEGLGGTLDQWPEY
jgi:hypothetical protein